MTHLIQKKDAPLFIQNLASLYLKKWSDMTIEHFSFIYLEFYTVIWCRTLQRSVCRLETLKHNVFLYICKENASSDHMRV